MTGVQLPVRGRWDGMTQIVRYNKSAYALAVLAIVVLGLTAALIPLGVAWVAAALVATSALLSLIVSHVVYDRSCLHAWTWLDAPLPSAILVLHAGLDEAGIALRRLHPRARMVTLDIFNAKRMTEPAIRVARASGPAEGTPARHDELPVARGSMDLVMLFFVAHELRARRDRIALMKEVRRSLAPNGRAVVVEHLRDAANTLAFGPGSFHFFSRRDWSRTFAAAGLCVQQERRITPFVRVLYLEEA